MCHPVQARPRPKLLFPPRRCPVDYRRAVASLRLWTSVIQRVVRYSLFFLHRLLLGPPARLCGWGHFSSHRAILHGRGPSLMVNIFARQIQLKSVHRCVVTARVGRGSGAVWRDLGWGRSCSHCQPVKCESVLVRSHLVHQAVQYRVFFKMPLSSLCLHLSTRCTNSNYNILDVVEQCGKQEKQ